jgi:hypothetical protein
LTKRIVGWAGTGIAAELDTQSDTWKSLPGNVFAGRPWSSQVLYRSPNVDVDGLFARGRLAMFGVTLLCAILIAVVSYHLVGPIAAIAATLVFAGHPLVLAHGPLITADVASALTALALAVTMACLLDRATLPRAALVGPIREPGVIAISVTSLQGTYASPEFDPAKVYAPLKSLPQVDVLDGSIYLYAWNPQ